MTTNWRTSLGQVAQMRICRWMRSRASQGKELVLSMQKEVRDHFAVTLSFMWQGGRQTSQFANSLASAGGRGAA